MKILIILNTISIWILIIFMSIRPLWKRLEFTIEKTFFEEIPYGVNITLFKKPKREYPNSGKSIFYFCWRNEDKIKDSPQSKEK